MIYKDYGNTGEKVSVIGFGGMRFENPEDIENSSKLVLYASEKGINYFDTAPGYCNNKSEIIMGNAFKEMRKNGRKFYVSTKSDKSKGYELRKDLENSLKRLNVDQIDFYNCWNISTLEDWEKRKREGAINELFRAKEEGLIKHISFSTHLPGDDIRKVIEEELFEGVTLGYSAINFPYREDGILSANEKKMGVVVMNPLGGGLIMNNEETFSFLKIREKQSMLEAAIHFLLSHNLITVSLVGLRNHSDVESICSAVDSFVTYTKEEIDFIRDHVTSDFNNLCTTCMYCNVCPEKIGVWKFMETSNHIILNGGHNPNTRLEWYWGTHISKLDSCTRCGACERACTQKLPIISRLKKLKRSCRLFSISKR